MDAMPDRHSDPDGWLEFRCSQGRNVLAMIESQLAEVRERFESGDSYSNDYKTLQQLCAAAGMMQGMAAFWQKEVKWVADEAVLKHRAATAAAANAMPDVMRDVEKLLAEN